MRARNCGYAERWDEAHWLIAIALDCEEKALLQEKEARIMLVFTTKESPQAHLHQLVEDMTLHTPIILLHQPAQQFAA